MDKQTPQVIAKKLEESGLFTSVQYSPRYNTVSVYYDEMAKNAQEVEAMLAKMGFNEPGRGFSRNDQYRIDRQGPPPTEEEIMARLRTVVGAQYLFKDE